MTPKFKLGRDFCTIHLPPKFHHPMFTRSEVIMLTNKQTNKQTPLKTSNALRYATTLGNKFSSLRQRPSEIILFQRVETYLELFQNYFRGRAQLINRPIFQHVQCRRNIFEIISGNSFSSRNSFISVSAVATCEILHWWNNFRIIWKYFCST